MLSNYFKMLWERFWIRKRQRKKSIKASIIHAFIWKSIVEFRVGDFVDVKMWDGHKLSGIWHSLMESHVDSSCFAMIWWLKRKKKSCTVVKDIRCILKLDLWPPQGWPCGCQHDPSAQNSLHLLSQTNKKLKKHDSFK